MFDSYFCNCYNAIIVITKATVKKKLFTFVTVIDIIVIY